MNVSVVDGNLLDQNVDVIVNAWSRNIIPWWLLFAEGVSGAIKNPPDSHRFVNLENEVQLLSDTQLPRPLASFHSNPSSTLQEVTERELCAH